MEVGDVAALARLEVEDEANWGILDIVTSRPLYSDTTFAMNSLNRKRRDEGLSPVKTVKKVFYMALVAANNESDALVTQFAEITAELGNEKSKKANGARAISVSDRKIEEMQIALLSSRGQVSALQVERAEEHRSAGTLNR